MSNIYVRSTDGNDSDNGSTWALAKATLNSSGAGGIDAAGDNIFVSQVHAEASASFFVLQIAGTISNPSKVISVNDAAEPPVASHSGKVVITSVSTFAIEGSAYIQGFDFGAGLGVSVNVQASIGGSSSSSQHYKNCIFRILTTNDAAQRLDVGPAPGTTEARIKWEGVSVQFSAVGQHMRIAHCQFEWIGGAVIAGASTTTLLYIQTFDGANVLVEGVDLSALPSACVLAKVLSDYDSVGTCVFRGCKLPTGWSGGFGVPGNMRFELYNCDDGVTNYRMLITEYAGSIYSETTVVRGSGANDGTTALSWKMVTTADAKFPAVKLRSNEILFWCDAPGVALALEVHVVTDGVTLKESECWLEASYPSTYGNAFTSDIETNTLTGIAGTSANQASSSESWTTTGLSSPIKQKLSISVTPHNRGWVIARVVLCKASTTVYVDPEMVSSSSTTRQAQIPGGPYVNLDNDREAQLPGYAFLDNYWQFTESIRPTGVTLTNLSGAYTDIDDDPGTPDASWLTET